MRLTTFTDYCLRVLIYLAARDGKRSTIAEIACSYGISEHHLVKVVHFLGQAGFLTNVRGRGGGLQLARAPESINIGAVVREAEGPIVPAACFENPATPCTIAGACELRGVLSEAVTSFNAVLDRYTLAHLVTRGKRLSELRSVLVQMPGTSSAVVHKGRSGKATGSRSR